MESSLVDVEDDGGAGYTWEGEYERPWLVTVCFDALLLVSFYHYYFKNIYFSFFHFSYFSIFLSREAIQEDMEGRILAPDDDFLYKSKRRK